MKMKTTVNIILITAVFACAFFQGCTSETVNYGNPDSEIYDSGTMSLGVRVTTGDDPFNYNEIKNLMLYFFEDVTGYSVYIGSSEAIATSKPQYYRASYPKEKLNEPSFVVAIANHNTPIELQTASDLFELKTNSNSDKGIILMTSTRGFDPDTHKDIYYSLLSQENFDETDPAVIEIFLERNVAKASAINYLEEGETFVVPALTYKGSEARFETHLTGWGISATDSESFVVKNLGNGGFPDISAELALPDHEWNIPVVDYLENEMTEGALGHYVCQWAHSPGWSRTSFPAVGEEDNAEGIDFLSFSNLDNNFSTEQSSVAYFVNETTRQRSVYDIPNALPMLIVGAVHKLPDFDENVSFYVVGNNVLPEEEFWEYIASTQTALFEKETMRLSTAEELSMVLETAVSENGFWNKLRVRLKDDADLSVFADRDGVAIDTADKRKKINDLLFLSCGEIEKFKDGKAVYMIPVIHFDNKEESREGTTLYGIVRNNHYAFHITGIESLGCGVSSDEKILGEPDRERYDKFGLEVRVTLNPWFKVSTTTNIEGD